jgi:hypothetical protein
VSFLENVDGRPPSSGARGSGALRRGERIGRGPTSFRRRVGVSRRHECPIGRTQRFGSQPSSSREDTL